MTQLIECACLWLLKDNHLLLARSRDYNKWFLPGGKIEKGESPIDSLKREIREELGVSLLPGSIKYRFSVKDIAFGKPVGHYVVLNCYAAVLMDFPVVSGEVKEIKYFPFTGTDVMAPAVQSAVIKWQELESQKNNQL
ncbi:NUDIX domain-containing protein [Candidatus Haliotispira prima]|uniref:NUDIX domain-containing protein n=1 Tax=Candidatus Haliotispira prima TaxID=3034016 RepID=A0ABY8MGC1_9SPIO|nr:NUDIX domain-containing protein [Candidatus Haliotispira prima]